jgi:hypothetical protein
MSLLRVCAVAVIAACLVAAQPRLGCPALSGSSALFTNTSSTCAQETACTNEWTTCIAKNTTSCENAAICIATRFACLFTAAANTTGCRQLNNVQLALLRVSSGSQRFNASDAGLSCAASACRWLNESLAGNRGQNCSLDYDALCQSPIFAVATIVFRGNFSAILADPVKREALANAIRADFARALKLVIAQIRIRRLYIVGSRRQATQTLVAEVEVAGVSANNADFATTIAAIKANPGSFFTSTSSAYSSLNPGQTLEVTGVGVGTASAAFSSGIPTGTTAAPTTRASNTTAAPAGTTSAPSSTTRAPTASTTTTSGSGITSAVLAVVAAAVLAVVC